MITFKEAIKVANDCAAEIFQSPELRDIRVEAINRSDDGMHWYVTLGWVAPETRIISNSNPLSIPTGPEIVEAPRVYKKFKISSDSGEVIAMSEGD